jgi:hypothetical protein
LRAGRCAPNAPRPPSKDTSAQPAALRFTFYAPRLHERRHP